VYHVQTESSNRLSQREFTKQMSRNGIETSRKRAANASRDSNLISGVTVTWNIDDLERQRLINIYFDGTDQRLLQNTNISYTDKVNSN